jgi:UDP-N-acetylmuramoyl-tripeptide--D-alanyl-D-alanine ligase
LANLIFTILFVSFLFQKTNFLYWFSFGLLCFDILSPFLVSAVVLLFQPTAVLLRNRIIKKATKKRESFKNLIVIGITGSYGKTSTKEFLSAILSEKFNVLKTKEHQNSEVGVSQCILEELKPEHEVFVCEMAAYNRGGIKLLCGIAKPKIGVLTGINEQHMATFGSQENIIKAKYELIESLPEDGIAFFNAKNKYCREMYERTKIKKFLYGENAAFFGEENILGAMAVARELGMTQEEISRAVGKIENKFSGVQFKKGVNGINIIDATYSANPDGVLVHLEYLKNFPGKKVIVMPCLIELGKASKEVHKRLGKKIAEVCDLAIITTKDRFKEIVEGATNYETGSRNILFLENPKQIFEKIKEFYRENDVVLLESRVPELLIKQLLV